MNSQNIITNLTDLLEIVLETNSRFKGQIWWRGQRDSSWNLTPSIFRKERWAKSERSFVARFQHKAPSRHPKVPPYEDRASWLFLMQHYRLPTRLLDWTESPLIACFFAIEKDRAAEEHPDIVKDADGALFAISPYQLNRDQVGSSSLLLPDDPKAESIIERAFSSNGRDIPKVVAIRPSEVDIRLTVQLSVFTLHGGRISLEKLPQASGYLSKWSIPSACKEDIRNQLQDLGIRASSVFPDLEHLAQDVSATEFERLSISRAKSISGGIYPPRDPEPST